MSIVTDALNRLQSSRADVVRPTAAHDPNPPQSQAEDFEIQNESETSEDEKKASYDTRFLSVSIGGFLVVLAFAMGAYWWGESFVSDMPIVVGHSSARADVSPEPVVPKNMEIASPNQKRDEVTLDNNSRPEGQLNVLPGVESQEGSTPSETLEVNKDEPSIRTPRRSTTKPAMEQPAQVKKVSSSPVDQSLVPNRAKEKQVVKDLASAISLNERDATKKKVVSRISMGSSQKSIASQKTLSILDQSKELSRSDFSLGIPGDEDSEDLQSAKRLLEVTKDSKKKKKRRVQHVASLSVKEESTLPAMGKKEKSRNGLKGDDKKGHSNSPQSLPVAVVKKVLPSKNMTTSVSKVHSRLSPKQRLVKARLLIERQSHAKAINVLKPLFATPPTSWEPWFWMGTAYFGNGELDKAEDALMEGLVRDDTVPHLWVQRAVIAQQRGQYRKAMDALRQAELLDPDLPEVQLNLAYNFEHHGNPKLARRHYREFLSLTEGKPTYHDVRRKVLERVLSMSHS